jgi:hypothetical protein
LTFFPACFILVKLSCAVRSQKQGRGINLEKRRRLSALRKKTQTEKDSDPQTQEEAAEEQTQEQVNRLAGKVNDG